MNSPPFVAVEATEERYRALRHAPTGTPLDEDGRGIWPDDSFTRSLERIDRSIRVIDVPVTVNDGAVKAAKPVKEA
jgi:hypothetical protein